MAIIGGYTGIATIEGLEIRCTGFTVNVKQEPLFYDHILGLRDSTSTGNGTKGDNGELNLQKYAWRPGVKLVSGNISFPATTDSLNLAFNLTKFADDFTMTFIYNCGGVKRTFYNCKVNNMTFNLTASEFVTVDLEVMGGWMEESTGSIRHVTPQKLITWDAVKINSISSDPVFSFNFSVNNACMPIYTAGENSNSLYPYKIRVGMQSLTGGITYYRKGISYDPMNASTGINKIDIDIESFSLCEKDFNEVLCVIYKPIERSGNIGAVLNFLPFVGVGLAMGGRAPNSPESISVPENSPSGDYTVTWEYPEDEEEDILGFELDEASSPFAIIASPGPTDRTYDITGKEEGVYIYRIRAINEWGNSEYIASDTVTVGDQSSFSSSEESMVSSEESSIESMVSSEESSSGGGSESSSGGGSESSSGGGSESISSESLSSESISSESLSSESISSESPSSVDSSSSSPL